MINESQVNVLLIQPNPTELVNMQKLLAEQSYTPVSVVVATDVNSGLAKLAGGQIDALILDLHMFEEAGNESMQKIKEQFSYLPVIAINNNGYIEAESSHLWGETLDFLDGKSLNGQLLGRTIDHAVKRQQLARRADESAVMAQYTLDGLSAHIAVLDANGEILAVNEAWRQFAMSNPPITTNVLEGANYLAVCDAAQGPDAGSAAAFAAGLRAVLAGERPYFQQEYPCHSPEEKRWFIGRVTRFPGDAGPARAIVAHENITARKLAEDELRKFERGVEQSPVSIVFTDREGVIEYINPTLTEITGYTVGELLGKNPRIFKSGHTTEAEYEQLWQTITNGQPWEGEFLNCKKDGTYFWEYATISPIKDEAGNITHFVGIKKEITQEKKAAAILAESEQRYRALFENARDAIFVNDLNGRFLDANQITCQRLGYSLNELRQMHLEDIDPIEYSRLNPDRTGSLQEQSYAFYETIHVSKKGEVIPTEVGSQFFVFGDQKALLSVARDITERKKIMKAEYASRKFAEALADTAAAINNSLETHHILKAVLEKIEKVVYFEMAMVMLVDGEFAEVIDLTHSTHKPMPHGFKGMRVKIADFPTFTRLVSTQEPLIVPFVNLYPGWVEMPAFPEISSYLGVPICANEAVLGFINLASSQPQAFSDEDAQRLQALADQVGIALKNAQLFAELGQLTAHLEEQVQQRTEQIRHDNERLQAVLYNSADKILVLDLHGNIEMANLKFLETFGLKKVDIVGQPVLTVLPIEDKATLIQYLDSISKGIDPARMEMETTAVKLDGSVIDVELTLAPVKNGSISGIVCNIRNITPFKIAARAKDAFVANVSHELKSPINSIGLYHQLLQTNPEKKDTYLPILERETNRLTSLLDDLLQLSRLDQDRVQLNLADCDLNLLVSKLIEDRQLVAALKDVTLSVETLVPLPTVSVDAGLIEEGISILLTNAINYTPPSGKIWVSTHLRQQEGMTWCGVSVRDTGPGVTLDEQFIVFERFYRGVTGQGSQTPGTGLGLAIAADIVRLHQGVIDLYSEGVPGKGSTFTIWLPCSNTNYAPG